MSKKLQDKQLRRQLQEERRKQQRREARRRNYTTLAIIAVVVVVVVGLIVNERLQDSGTVTGVPAAQADCNDIERPPDEGADHVPDGVDVQYNTTPPTSGNHYGETAPVNFYPPATAAQIPEERFVHNMEHGQVVIWYSPGAPEEIRESLEDFIEDQPTKYSRTLLGVPYEQVPSGFNYTMTAWGAIQSCKGFSAEAINNFRAEFQGKGPEQFPDIPPFEEDEPEAES